MFRITIVLVILFSFTKTSFGQSKSILVFFDNVFNEEEFYAFENTTEQTLKGLYLPTEMKQKLFNKVLVANEIAEIEDYLGQIRKIIKGEIVIPRNSAGEKALEALNDNILNVDYFLVISVKASASTLIYTIKKYKTLKEKDRITFLSFDVGSKLCSKEIFIQKNKLKEEQNNFIQTLKQCFQEANLAPIPKVVVDGQQITANKEIVLGYGDTITLDGSSLSIDSNDSPTRLLYYWEQLNTAGLNINQVLIRKQLKGEKQNLILDKLGSFDIGLIIDDGIVNSDTFVIRVKVVERPIIEMTSHSSIKERRQGNMLTYGYKLEQELFFNHKHLTLQDTVIVKLYDFKPSKTYEIFIGKDSLQQHDSLTSDKLRLKINNRLETGRYLYEIETRNNLLTSPKEYFTIDYQTDFFGWVNGSYEGRIFTFSDGATSQQIAMDGIQMRVRAFMAHNIALEAGFGDVYRAATRDTTIENIQPFKALNHGALIYKIPFGIPKPQTNISVLMAYSAIHSTYNPIDNSLEYKHQLGLGIEGTLKLFKKLPIFLEIRMSIYRNQYQNRFDSSFTDNFLTGSIGLSSPSFLGLERVFIPD